jgi:transcriptional regulator with PAS, ATPase and Fis domain
MAADGGTIFLDEINSAFAGHAGELLRVLFRSAPSSR